MTIPFVLPQQQRQPRIVELTTEEFSYSTQIWPIVDGQEYKSRILLLHNPGEDVTLYHPLISLLANNGYETMFAKLTNIYKADVDIYREINRILEICIKDLDEQAYVKSHKLHLMGHFIAGSRILAYGVRGRFKHRLKSVVSINPFIDPKEGFDSFVSQAATSIIGRLRPKSNATKFPITYQDITSDKQWITYFQEKQYNFSKIQANYLREVQHISNALQHPKKYADFTIKNVLVIQSEQDPVSTVEGAKHFVDNCPSENANLLVYPNGKNNLLLETETIYEKLSQDLLQWFAEN